ncbi:unnamed protein product [Linum trigynum]|uniref:Uncharacterized protein n=1 Tax=Linum trigynum TaxID=586398 RepID=A0AAV2CC83_9ROSI
MQIVGARIEDSNHRIGKELAGFRTMMEKVLENMVEQRTQEPRPHEPTEPTEPTRSAAEAALSKVAVVQGSGAGRAVVARKSSRTGQGNVGPLLERVCRSGPRPRKLRRLGVKGRRSGKRVSRASSGRNPGGSDGTFMGRADGWAILAPSRPDRGGA